MASLFIAEIGRPIDVAGRRCCSRAADDQWGYRSRQNQAQSDQCRREVNYEAAEIISHQYQTLECDRDAYEYQRQQKLMTGNFSPSHGPESLAAKCCSSRAGG